MVLVRIHHSCKCLRKRRRASLFQHMQTLCVLLFVQATIGYGDRVPRNVAGKVLTMFWALAGLSLMSVLIATMTTLLTEHRSVIATLSTMKNSRVSLRFLIREKLLLIRPACLTWKLVSPSAK